MRTLCYCCCCVIVVQTPHVHKCVSSGYGATQREYGQAGSQWLRRRRTGTTPRVFTYKKPFYYRAIIIMWIAVPAAGHRLSLPPRRRRRTIRRRRRCVVMLLGGEKLRNFLNGKNRFGSAEQNTQTDRHTDGQTVRQWQGSSESASQCLVTITWAVAGTRGLVVAVAETSAARHIIR